jgi:outer membrane protein
MNFIKSLAIILWMMPGLAALQSPAQTTRPQPLVNTADSLTFTDVLKQVLASYPAVLRAQEAIQAADAAVGLARSAYFPNIDAGAGYTFIGPVAQITLPGSGSFDLYPQNNYNISAAVQQTVWDFSKTKKNVAVELSNKELSEKNVDLVKQRVTLLTAVSYYTLIYLQEAIRIKDLQIETLGKHLAFVTKKMQTGSATQYEILSTQVRVSNAENQKVDLETSRSTQLSILNSLMGFPVNTPLKVRKILELSEPEIPADSLLPYALQHRYEMVMAKLRQERAQLRLHAVKAMDLPTLNAFATGGWKNGYIPDLNKFTANYALGVGLRVPIFDATRKKNTILLARSDIGVTKQEADQTTLDISVEVTQNEAALNASVKKITQSTLQVQQASEALGLANTSFTSGAITNLDLLDAETALEESRINLLKARIEYAINVVRLNLSLGTIIW